MQVNESPVSLLPRSCCHLLGLDSKRTHSRAAWWDTTPASRQDRSPRDIHMDRQLVRKCSRKHDSCLSFPPSPHKTNTFSGRTGSYQGPSTIHRMSADYVLAEEAQASGASGAPSGQTDAPDRWKNKDEKPRKSHRANRDPALAIS